MKRLMRVIVAFLVTVNMVWATNSKTNVFLSKTFSGLKFRSIGPAFSSGRIADFAVNPDNHSEYYVAVAAGNVWKTTNSGTTYEPIFDSYGAWSTASVVIDPNNPHVIWVGTGEYNSQRAIGYGDGVYRSEDGGASFKHRGLKNSEHIGRIIIDPRNSAVYVAAQGPLWGPGGERGLYKSTDNGKSWKRILYVSENTGITDIVMDPRDQDVLYAASYQRRRRVFTLINGGPESAIYKSTDAGASWNKLTNGLPKVDLGRIGLAISPARPDIIYAIVEAHGDAGGFFRSINRGASWEKMSDYMSRSPQYYNRIIPDPIKPDQVYSLDTYTVVTTDGGKTWTRLGNKNRHVDDHAMWIDPNDTGHILIGGDGGIYETFDNASAWHFKSNLPVTQFYRVSADNSEPFYYVYGGTQDNNSMGGPSRTIRSDGIINEDWFVTNGGDGFESCIDPKNPNIVYAQAQYGWLVRYDKKSGESIFIQPQPPAGEAYRWNWNAPLIISPHLHSRLYFGANKLFRSDDRGNTWQVISPDLTRQLDRNTLPVMGKKQSVDAVSKNKSTSIFGNIVSLTESPLVEGLFYVGTDDGLVQVTEDGGAHWRKIDKFPGVHKMTYVSCLLTSLHDANTVYAAFDGRKNNDLAPHILVSTDRGKNWRSIAANLPDRGSVFTIAEDHVKPDLLFIGTEFGVYFTIDGGKKWTRLKNGIPTTSVKDIAIQRRENDLVLATFGRGFYILDDYTPLRHITPNRLESENIIFPIKDALMYIQQRGKRSMGQSYYAAENSPFGATFTYYLKDTLETLRDRRQKAEKKAAARGETIRYPDFDELRLEDNEEPPYLLFTITDEQGNIVRRLIAKPKSGINRITWDLRYPPHSPVTKKVDLFKEEDGGLLALPGKYFVSMAKVQNQVTNELVPATSFNAVVLNNTTLPAEDREALVAFQKKVSELGRAVEGALKTADDLREELELIDIALHNTTGAEMSLFEQVDTMKKRTSEVLHALTGDITVRKRSESDPPSIRERVQRILYGFWRSTSAPTQTMRDQYKIAGDEFSPQLAELKQLIEVDLNTLKKTLEQSGAPWTPGRVPMWNK